MKPKPSAPLPVFSHSQSAIVRPLARTAGPPESPVLRSVRRRIPAVTIVAAFAFGAPAVQAQTYYWAAFAGLPPQIGSADGVGTAARFYQPRGLVATTTGIVYVCDANNYTIRRISPDGAVATLAGSAGERGTADGTGTGARFGFPTGITVSNGFLFVTDATNHTIRQIGGNGTVATFAGLAGFPGSSDGSASSARFNGPSAIDNDGQGNLYIADTGNHVIRRITSAGEVTTVAGSPGTAGSADGTGTAARFNEPGGLFILSTGAIYVADTGNHTIRRISADGVVTTVAGLAGVPGTASGVGSAGRFNYPKGILAYTDGTALVCDANHVVRVVSPAGNVSTLVGRLDVEGSRDGVRTEARFYYPSALAFTNDGFLVADTRNHSVRKVTFPDSDVTTFAGSPGNFGRNDGLGAEARFNYPNGVAVHQASGDLYMADSRGNAIRRITRNGHVMRVAGQPTGDAYTDGPADVQSLNYPFGVAVAPDRTIYFCEQQRHTIRVVQPDGSVSTLAGQPGSIGSADGAGSAARFNYPSGIALDGDGNLYIADSGNSTIRRIAAGTNTVQTFAGLPLTAGSADGTAAARFRFPSGIATDAAGNIYVADTNNHTIRRITPAGEVSTLAGQPGVTGAANGAGATARFYYPFALTVAADGTIYVADLVNSTLRRIVGDTVSTIGGTVLVQSFSEGPGTASFFSGPSGVAVDNAGNIYVSESGNNIIRRGEILARPTLIAEPRSVAVAEGSRATFAVEGTGGGLRYQWQRNGIPISGATNATYTVANVSASSAGQYSVTVTNSLGSIASSNATLTVAPASDAGRLINLSILTSLTSPGDRFTLGFVVGGSGTTGAKPLLIRAAGPSLGALGVPDTLADPQFELYSGPRKTGENDNWGGRDELVTAMRNVGAFAFVPATSRDAAAIGSFDSGNNSATVSAVGSGTGTVIAEIYDATPTNAWTAATPRLVNVSVLKHIGGGLVAGFAIGGNESKTVLIRAVGPTLETAPFGVQGVVTDPQLTLFSGQTAIGSNDNWRGAANLSAAFAQVGAFPLPAESRDAALLATLAPGPYTVEVTGVGGTTGVALVEVYEVP